jgi:hypothetical protein
MITLQAIPNTNQVVISNETMSVTVVDGHSANNKPERQLPGSSLVTILSNMLRYTSLEHTVKDPTQDWSYKPTGDSSIDLYEDNYNSIYLERDDNVDDSIELVIVDEGTFSNLRCIFGLTL